MLVGFQNDASVNIQLYDTDKSMSYNFNIMRYQTTTVTYTRSSGTST
jgi:hypothetical protein